MTSRDLFKFVVFGLSITCCGQASGQTFANIPALSFTAPYAGANPLPQTLTVNSTGAVFNFSVSATSAGGNWLSVSPSGGDCCITPGSVRVVVAPASPLAVGSYSGQIVFTKYGGTAATLTVPVTYTVSDSSSTALFDSLPGQVSFSFVAGGNAPPGQIVQVRNAGSGTLSWTLSSSTPDGGSWLTVSSAGGTAPFNVSIGVTPSALPGGGQVAGTYIGQLVFKAATGSVSIPVSVTVGANVFAQVNALNFTKPYAGNDPLPQTITIASTGSNFNIDAVAYNGAGGNWLSVTPSGTDCCATPESITVNVHPSVSLAAGAYTGEIVITQYAGNTMAMTVPVTLTIGTASSQAFFDNTPGQISFSLKTKGAAPPSQPVQALNAGAATLSWTLLPSTADGGKWLTVSPASGTAPSMISVGLNPANLPNCGQVAGTFVGQLLLQTTGDAVTIPVSVMVDDNVFEQVNGIDFTKPYAGSDPLPQTLTIASTGANFNFDVAAYTANGGSWLTVSPSGTDCCATTESIKVSVNSASSLPAGIYTGQVVITQYAGNSMAMTVPVTLTVRSAAFFDNLPGQMSFSFATGGNTPPNQIVQIRNGGSGTLTWTVAASTSDGGKWITTSAASGTAPSTLSVGINKAALPGGGQVAGTFTGQLVFQTAGDTVTIPVSVFIGNNVFEQVNGINFTKPYSGANPLPQTLMIAGIGTNFNIDVSASTANGGSWLQVIPSGTDCCATPVTLTVSVNPSVSLAAGFYTGEILITQYAGNGMTMTVPVTLTVAPSSNAFFDNLPGQITFSMVTGGNAPPPQPLQIRNGGSETLNWSVSSSTSDGGNWLTISATSGTVPSTISIGVTPALLPNQGKVAGIFTGQLVFQAPGDVVTIPVSVTVGANVFEQVNALNFTKPYAGANPLPQTITVASTGTNFNIDVAASTANGGNWLTVTPSGTDCCVTPESFTVSVNPASSLAAGTYTGQIVFTQYAGNAMSMTVPVTLTVAASESAFFDNLQGQLSFSMVPGGTLANHSLQIRNGGTGMLNWTLSTTTADGGNWLTASLTDGTAPSAVTIGVNAAALPNTGQVAGIYTGQVLLTTAGDAVTIPVSVIIGSNVFQQLDALTFSKSAGGSNLAAQTLTVSSTGANFNIDVAGYNGNGGSWLQVTPSGTDCCAAPKSLTVSVNPSSSLPAGVYTGQIVATQYGWPGQAMTIPIYLAVATSTLTPTTTSLRSSVNPSNYGQSVTFAATITGGTGAGITGTVTFYDGGTVLGAAAVSSATATLTIASLTSGNHPITAVYSGNSTYSESNSPVLTQSVGPGGTVTATSLTSSLNPSIQGATVTFVAVVSSSTTGVAGTVTFKDGSTTLATVTLASGTASYSASALSAGSHSITAAYSGGGGFAPSASPVLVQRVLIPTTTALSASSSPVTFGQFVTLTATVSGAAAGSNGYVTFFDGSTPLSSVPLNGETAVLAVSSLAKGTNTISAVYGGSAVYAGSSSPAGSVVVQ